MISPRLQRFGTSIFTEMRQLADDTGAVNLSQGFPEFDTAPEIVAAAVRALQGGDNQYARSQGHPRLVRAIAASFGRRFGRDVNPMREVGVFSGATEGIASSMLGLLRPGDEVILLEPFYDCYPPCVSLADARARFVTLRFPDFRIERAALEECFNDRTRLLVLNNPHNPTGKVFTRQELTIIAELCQQHDVLVMADEVYEHLTYDGAEHIPIATLPGMWERTLTFSSAGKTYSCTGWKVGWGVGHERLIAAAQAAHQFVTFSTATPLQVAIAWALDELGDEFYETSRQHYTERRDLLLGAIRAIGLKPKVPAGTFFILADFSEVWDGDDRSFAHHLAEKGGVVSIPPSFFYTREPEAGKKLIRFTFCKNKSTLEEAARRLARLKR